MGNEIVRGFIAFFSAALACFIYSLSYAGDSENVALVYLGICVVSVAIAYAPWGKALALLKKAIHG